MVGGRAEVVDSKECSRIFPGFHSSISSLNSFKFTALLLPASSTISEPMAPGPFAGLVICVTGLSKVRMSESLYSVRCPGENGMPLGELNQLVGLSGAEKSCLPHGVFENEKSLSTMWQNQPQSFMKELRSGGSVLSSYCIYIDSDISTELKKKVVDAATREGATILEHWFIGCPASHVVCEGPSIQRYIGHASHLVTPLWILKTVKEKFLQRLVHLSSDLARQVMMILENPQITVTDPDAHEARTNLIPMSSRKSFSCGKSKETVEERQKLVEKAKLGVRTRRSFRLQKPLAPKTTYFSIL